MEPALGKQGKIDYFLTSSEELITIFMRRPLISLLVMLLLLSQWGGAEHAYHEHEENEVCEVCLSASGHAAATSSSSQLPPIQDSGVLLPVVESLLATATPRFYATRAPPRSL
ncbi:MAG: hypothetical protein ABFS08_11070 [Pseudomonadota bacterium]